MPNTTLLDPKQLGFWIKCIREGQRWSQEALAAAANVDVRTVQRIEAGEKASVTTRRAIARGLGYDNQDVFDDPKFIEEILRFFELIEKNTCETAEKKMQKQFPDHRRLAVARVASGPELLRLVSDVNAIQPDASSDLGEEAQELAAQLFDYLRDCLDIMSDVSFADRLAFGRECDVTVTGLTALGAVIYTGSRSLELRNDNWQNKEPLPMRVLYMTVVPATQDLKEVLVPRRVSFG